jgi:hypothetical protein
MVRWSRKVVGCVLAASILAACGQTPIQTLSSAVLGLQSAVIADGQSGGLSPTSETRILKWLTQLETAIIAEANGGPSAAVKTVWASALADIPQPDQTKYAVLIGAISGAVNAL